MPWRWDQGRLEYFQFENVRAIATALLPLRGVSLSSGDPLRIPLMAATGLPFAPARGYSLWRNYGRTLQAGLLATEVGGRLETTAICAALASSAVAPIGSDDYFGLLISRFRFPFPGFAGYSSAVALTYPFCSVIRFLLAKLSRGLAPEASLAEIFSHVVGNRCSGSEPLAFYSTLARTAYAPAPDETRQVREMLIVLSQVSVLNWHAGKLILDIDPAETSAHADLERLATPAGVAPAMDRRRALLDMGVLVPGGPLPTVPSRETTGDVQFTEGKRVRYTHLRTERNRSLRKEFFASLPAPYQCAVCGVEVNAKYPWVQNLLEVHHILPLSSPARIGTSGTKLTDLVALCPNCHGAVHEYYRRALDRASKDDFATDAEAKQAYADARAAFVP